MPVDDDLGHQRLTSMLQVGRLLIAAGIVLGLVGLVLVLGPKLPGASWIGRLPGDILIERPGFKIYVPLATCLLASVGLTIILMLFRR